MQRKFLKRNKDIKPPMFTLRRVIKEIPLKLEDGTSRFMKFKMWTIIHAITAKELAYGKFSELLPVLFKLNTNGITGLK